MTMSSPQSELDTSSFMGQMAARYRERMSMAFAVSNTINQEAYSTKLTDGMEETILKRAYHTMTDDGDDKADGPAVDPHEGSSDTKTSRSMSDLNRTSYSLKPSMKELIKKFEKRSFTSNQLKESDPSCAERMQAMDFFRGACEIGNLQQSESMGSKNVLQCPLGPPIESVTEMNELCLVPQASCNRGCVAECENLTDAVTGRRASSPEAAKARAEKTLSQFKSFEDAKVSAAASADQGRICMARDSEGMHASELEKMLDNIVPGDGWTSPLQMIMSGVESKTPSPLRTSLRGIGIRGKLNSSNDSKFVVHKKEWGRRYSSRGTSNSIVYSPYSVHEIQSKTKSDSGRSVITTPSNTLQRAEIRRTLNQQEAKQEEREKSASKNDMRSNAMERYMKFLKHTTPPLPSSAAGGKAVVGKGSSRPPTPRKPLNVNKRKIGQIKKTVLNAAKASGCVVVTNRLKPVANKEDPNGERRGKATMNKIKSKISTTTKTVDSHLKTGLKRQLERKKSAKCKAVTSIKEQRSDLSCGDTGTALSNASSINILPNSSEVTVTIEPRRKQSAKSAPRPAASKLPTKILNEKRCPDKRKLCAASAKYQGSPSNRLSPTRELKSLQRNADHQRYPSASVSNNILVRDNLPYCSSKDEVYRIPRVCKPSKKFEDKIDPRAKSSPARLSNRACKRIVQSPKDIREKLFQKAEKDISDTEDKLLTEGELANNELIPFRADEKQFNSSSLNRFGFREKVSPASTIRKCSPRSHSIESECFERDYHLNSHGGYSSNRSLGMFSFPPETPPDKYKEEDSEKTISSALDDEGEKQFDKHDATSHAAAANGKQPTKKKALNTNSNLVGEAISSVSTYEDGDKSRTEDKFILTHLQYLAEGKESTRTSPEKGHLSHLCPPEKRSPSHKARRDSKDVLQELRCLEAYSSYSKEWAKDFGKGSRSTDGTDDRNSVSAFHNCEPLSKQLDTSAEDCQVAGFDSPIRKKRHLEKKKRSKRKKLLEESPDVIEPQQLQPYPEVNSPLKLLSTKQSKEKKLERLSRAAKHSESAKSQDVSRFQETPKYYDSPVDSDRQRYHDQSKNQEHHLRNELSKTQEHFPRSEQSKTQEHFPRNELSKTQEHFPRNELSKTQEHFPRNELSKSQEHFPRNELSKNLEHHLRSELSKYQEQLRSELSTKKLCEPSRTEQNTPALYHGAMYQPLPLYMPVRPVCSKPNEKCRIQSHIPVRCDSGIVAKKFRCNVLRQRRLWVEAYESYDYPCRIPITESFRACMDSAIHEEYQMHSWFPNSDRLSSLSCEDYTDPAPRMHNPRFTKDWLIEFFALLPYRKVGPMRMSQLGYLTLLLTTFLGIHVGTKLYNCGGGDFDYYCDDDDVDCFIKSRAA